jgi:hypothetical protein
MVNSFWLKGLQSLILLPVPVMLATKLAHGVMVALQILVLSVKVRILMGQQHFDI